MHGLADVQHGVEDDRVSGGLQLVSARDKMIEITLGDTFVRRLFFFLMTIPSSSYLMKTSIMDLQTSTLTLSFWNMSRNGRKRSWESQKSAITDYFSPAGAFHCEQAVAHH